MPPKRVQYWCDSLSTSIKLTEAITDDDNNLYKNVGKFQMEINAICG